MSYSPRTRYDDTLFIALLVIPVVFTATFYLQSESQIEQLASSSRPPVAIVKNVPVRAAAIDARLARAGTAN